MPTDYLWQHSDPRGMSAAIEAGIARGVARSWPSGASVEHDAMKADVRALLVASFYMVDAFSTLPAQPGDADGTGNLIIGDRTRAQFRSDERLDVVRTLLETWRTLVVADRKSNAPVTPSDVAGAGEFSTVGGGAAVPLHPIGEAGFGWPVAAVAIVGVTVQAGVVCYIADKVASVIDNQLTRREATRQMVATHSVVLQVLSGHRAAEETAGTELPLTDAEKAALKAVQNAQVQAQKSIKLEVPSLFPNLKDKGGKIIEAASNLGWGALAIAGLLAYVFLQKGK